METLIETKDRIIHRLETEQLLLRRQLESLCRSHAALIVENKQLRRDREALTKWNDEDRVKNRETWEKMMRLACHPALASQWVR